MFHMTPGPTEIPLSVLQAMMHGAVAPGDPDFIGLMDETERLLEELFQTKNWVVFFPGSGRVTIEAGLLSVLEPGDKVLIPVNGVFSKWIGITAERLGANPIRLDLDWRKAVDPDDIRATLSKDPNIKVVAVVHNETATGVVSPVPGIGKVVHEYGALFFVDSVSSLGGDEVNTDAWKIDLNCTGSYKCLNCVPGLSILSVSDRAWDMMSRRKRPARSFGFDLYRWFEMWMPAERGGKLIGGSRRHPTEPAPHLTSALHESVRLLLKEGLAERIRKNRVAGQAVRAGVKAIGLELYPLEEAHASNTVTAVCGPKGFDVNKVISTMRTEHGIVIGGGVEDTSGKLFRIAHMGTTSEEMYILETLFALEKTLKKLGYPLESGKAVEAARPFFARR